MRRVLVVFAFALIGCGPSTSQLVAHKHYREALCAQTNEDEVADALFADTNAYVHLHVVSSAELSSVVGDGAADIDARARFVRLTLETNRIPVDGIRVSVASEPAVIASPSWTRLARLTGEKLPPKERHTTSLTAKNFLNAGAILLTGGLWLLTDPSFERGEYYVDASSEKYRVQAPRAYALREATSVSDVCVGQSTSSQREEAVGLFCTTYLVVDRVNPMPIDLVLTFEYVGYRWKPEQRDYQPDEKDQCLTKRVVRVPLEGMPDATPRRVADVARAPRAR